MQPKIAILKPISSAISIGSGGPFGAEGPIIMTGGAVGSLIGQLIHLTASERKTLLVAGAAAGMSVIFASPLAAIFLAVELLLFEWKPRSLVPVAFASITASVMRPYLLGLGPLFPVLGQVEVSVIGVLACSGVGIVAGLFSTMISALLYKLEDAFHHLPCHWMWWCVLGGFVVGVGGYFEPRALGVGYDVIQDLLSGNILAQGALVLVGVKSLIWVVSLASGTSGGVLAPLLVMGCGLGVLEAEYFPETLKAFYPLISMAAVLGGIMRAPFTAVMFALELTHNFSALVPILTATIASYSVTVIIMKRSILTEKVARRGYDIFQEYSVDPLETVRVDEVMTQKVVTIAANLPIQSVVTNYFNGDLKYRGYPVTDERGSLLGILTVSDILGNRVEHSPLVEIASDLAHERVITAYPQESCREAAEKMALNGIGRLPVVSMDRSAKLLGIITRSDLIKPRLGNHESEKKRERVFKFRTGT